MNWIKTDDGTWMNLDYLSEIKIYKPVDVGQYMIKAWSAGEDTGFELYNKCFKTKEEAQEYLNQIMAGR